MSSGGTIVWMRRDLRLRDNDALLAALEREGPVYPCFIWAPDEEAPWAPGAASRWWLHQSLVALQREMRTRGLELTLRHGPSVPALRALVKETGATAVFWNRLYEPAVISRDKTIKAALRDDGVEARSFNAALLHEPWTVQTQQGRPYQVFTPFYRACQTVGDPSTPRRTPTKWPSARRLPSVELKDLNLLPHIPWYTGMAAEWTPGEAGAQERLEEFAARAVAYKGDRDRPDHEGTSRLSPHLHFGEISPRDIWWAVRNAHRGGAAEPYLRQLIWREFAHHLLYHFPHTTEAPLRPEFESFPWADRPVELAAWQRGLTGYPIVDAGMRELWHTGWMHNRVRMIVASFLVKDLLIPWQAGAAWFWDTLVDANLANNTLGWQWTAGCGADAAPYFRIFNPMLQGEKFDPDAAYVKRWVPELGAVDARWAHRVFEAPPTALAAAGVRPGDTYPRPLVDHAQARDAALSAYDRIKRMPPPQSKA
jgi:deoxyribodipyrimidine photo-lyase